jgi:hypothetical protein
MPGEFETFPDECLDACDDNVDWTRDHPADQQEPAQRCLLPFAATGHGSTVLLPAVTQRLRVNVKWVTPLGDIAVST